MTFIGLKMKFKPCKSMHLHFIYLPALTVGLHSMLKI